jgi:archaemetzincin
MKKPSRFVPFHSPPSELEIFYSQVSKDDIQMIKNALLHTYKGIIEVYDGGERELLSQAYTLQRDQYDADILLRHLLTMKKQEIALWVISKDLYTQHMNFIFGLARYFQGAVLSLFRLHSPDLKQKEAIHEIGHVLGLSHCTHLCVMQYSNSLAEAQQKPLVLCERCRRILNI